MYAIRGKLGAGGMSEVYEGQDLRLGRQVAIKVALPGVAAGLLAREAAFLAAFRHPGLVSVHALGEHDGVDYLVMERLTGRDLGEHIRRRRTGTPFSVMETLNILITVAEVLSVLHTAGLAHRDLKPENIMLEPHGRVVVMDFGIMRMERFIGEETTATGTPHYMAPETVLAQVEPGLAHFVDIYALGVTAYEMLAGQPPFDDPDTKALLRKHVVDPVPSLSELRPDIPVRLADLVHETLAKDPEKRPSSSELIAAELRAIRASLRAPAPEAALSVLIVDDDDDMRQLLRALVQQVVQDAEIRTARDGEDALRQFQQRPPNVLFLDLGLPGMNGLEVCMYLRGTTIADETSIVVVSAHADENRRALERLGIADVVAKKHGDPAEFARSVQTLLRRIEAARGRRPTRRDDSPGVSPDRRRS
jgi:serine/threonine-protein kinase